MGGTVTPVEELERRVSTQREIKLQYAWVQI